MSRLNLHRFPSRLITKYCALVTLLSINIGLAIGWTSPYLAQLTGEDSPFRVTDEEGSWIASLLPLGRLLGAVIGSLALEYIGSKTSVLLTGLPMIFSWICIICAVSPMWLYISRIFAGNSIGLNRLPQLSACRINRFIIIISFIVLDHIASFP